MAGSVMQACKKINIVSIKQLSLTCYSVAETDDV